MLKNSLLLLTSAFLLAGCDNSGKSSAESSSNWELSEKRDPLTDASKTASVTQIESDQYTAQVEMSCSVDTKKQADFSMAVTFFDNDKKGVEFKRQMVPAIESNSLPDMGANLIMRVGSIPMEKLFIPYDKLPYSNGAKICWTSKEQEENGFLALLQVIKDRAEALTGRSRPCLSDKSLAAMTASKSFAINPELASGSPTFVVDYSAAEPQRVINLCKSYFTVSVPATINSPEPSAEQAPQSNQDSAASIPDAVPGNEMAPSPRASGQDISLADIESCIAEKLVAYRRRNGSDAEIGQDLNDRWESECRSQ